MTGIVRESVLLGEREITIETGRMARQANGSVLVQYGDTVVLVTACGGRPRPDLSFFPLVCDYVEKTYSSGRIPGGYLKREGRLGSKETLTSRLIDRPIRPLFADGYKGDTQIVATVVSMDRENDADILAITGASFALMISDLPFLGPIAGVRIGKVDGKLIANPTFAQREESNMDLVLVASEKAILMVEGEADEITEEEFLEAMSFGRKSIVDVLALQHRFAKAFGKEKLTVIPKVINTAIVKKVEQIATAPLNKGLQVTEKIARYAGLDVIKKDIVAKALEDFPEDERDIKEAFGNLKSQLMRSMILDTKTRIGGRKFDEIREITCEVGILPRPHGSALFTRGETQALVSATLGTSRDEQRLDTLQGPTTRRFMLHYNFPPFSVGEVRPMRGPGRREIGHGILAERAIFPMLPLSQKDSDYPYTLRVVSEILESNGSSSMASVCGASLALIDAGVPLKKPVAGIAMGLVKEGDNFAILSDILGDEDHMGDMDFKVCGTQDGITSIQMDVKIAGISEELMAEALEQARKGRVHILSEMEDAIVRASERKSPYAPRIFKMKVKTDKIRDIIGAGGRTIRGIIAQTGAAIDVQDDGTVTIASDQEKGMEAAIKIIQGLTREPNVGEVFMGTVRRIVDFGAFIEIFPGTDGLCHVSELTEGHVDHVSDVLSEGDEVLVKVIAVDRQGKIKLSRRAAIGTEPTKLG